MKYRHVFWAFILIAIGVLFILNNFGILEFGWRALWSLWPLILIFWGISILPIRESIKIVSLIAVLAFTVIFFNKLSDRSQWWNFRNFHYYDGDWHDRDENEDEESTNSRDQELSVPFDSLILKGSLQLDAAAGNFSIQGLTSDMMTFSKTGNIGNYSITTNDVAGRKNINLSLEKGTIRHTVSENQVNIRLNDRPSWNMNLDIGAAEINMDLRDYKIDTAIIDAGASSIHIKLGTKVPVTVWTFNAGASSIDIAIPKEAGCQIKSESFMISKEFEGFVKKGDGIYQTYNFNSSPDKIYLNVKTAISKIEINRY